MSLSTVDFLPTLKSLLSTPKVPLIHRDLSWLQFNQRVLSEANQTSNPLLERVKFLAISQTNLDEFFMIRFSSLNRSILTAQKQKKANAHHLLRIRNSVLETVSKFTGKQHEAYDLLSAELEEAGIILVRGAREGDPAFAAGKQIFVEKILPHLTSPKAVSRESILSLKTLQMAVWFKGDLLFTVSRKLPQVFKVEDEAAQTVMFFFLDDLLYSHLGPAYRLESKPMLIRMTRDGDFSLDLEEVEDDDLDKVVSLQVGSRELGRPARIQYSGEVSEAWLRRIVSICRISPLQAFPAPASLCVQGLWTVFHETPEWVNKGRALRMTHTAIDTRIPLPFLRPETLFECLKREDILLHHPYDSFDAYLEWLKLAAHDPLVISIEQTIYRVDASSPVVQYLKAAAQLGKKVHAVIEVRARFDELNNLRVARELREAGVQVHFGFGKLKIHAKVALVTRGELDGVRRYTHLSTGNYHRMTSKQYTDFAILSADATVGEDARTFFDAVYREEVPKQFKVLLSAPTELHRRLLQLIRNETEVAKKLGPHHPGVFTIQPEHGKPRIVAKVNALVDDEVIHALYAASQAGVQVDLIVRGACSLIPGVKGLSENIRVISIVDRFLEHSRFYWFQASNEMYLSSADWMPRNFFSRLEIAFPVRDRHVYAYLSEVVIPTYLMDSTKASELTPTGTWKKRPKTKALRAIKENRSQVVFEKLALHNYAGTPLSLKLQ